MSRVCSKGFKKLTGAKVSPGLGKILEDQSPNAKNNILMRDLRELKRENGERSNII